MFEELKSKKLLIMLLIRKFNLWIVNLNIKLKINVILAFILSLFLFNCSNKRDIDEVVIKTYEKCSNRNKCIIDFAKIMDFQWDTMYYFSSANSLEDINVGLGFEYQYFLDIGDRVIFLNNNKIVYHKEWFPNPDVPFEGIVFDIDSKKMKLNKFNAKFVVRQIDKIYFLKQIDNP